MPDWSYQTVFRPLLFRLGPAKARSVALGSMGLLSRLPLGTRVIQLMGHMSPDPRLAVEKNGLRFPTQVGLGYALDPQLAATPALAEFGFGFLEIGPIAARPAEAAGKLHVDAANETLRFDPPRESITPLAAHERLARDGPFQVPVWARVEPDSPAEAEEFCSVLRPIVDGLVVPIGRLAQFESVRERETTGSLALFTAIDTNAWQDAAKQASCERALQNGLIQGVIVEAPHVDGVQQLGAAELPSALETVRQLRTSVGPGPIIVGAAAVHSPADALDHLDAGADLVQVDSGLVFAGPGLPKRINEANLYRRLMTESEPQLPLSRVATESWFWAFLMGLAMFVGGLIALVIATTRVVLPYDESLSGLTRAELTQINNRLLAFMTHDRVTLAGTMLAVGIQYIALAGWGIRGGVHWAYVSVVVSAFAGFFCFFSFLGFGYFDPFHAFVTAILFQFLLLTMHAHLPPRRRMEMPCLQNDGRWKASQWGQLLFVVHGAVLIVAGLVITKVGMTSVFVHEDLEFMQTSATDLFGAHPQLVPLVAHDRATFGGMLIACGVATFLPALWGFRRGQAWLWWSLMLAGTVAYVLTILVHWIVGYDSLMHLIPAYGGLALLWLGGCASYRFLVVRDDGLSREWEGRLERARIAESPSPLAPG